MKEKDKMDLIEQSYKRMNRFALRKFGKNWDDLTPTEREELRKDPDYWEIVARSVGFEIVDDGRKRHG